MIISVTVRYGNYRGSGKPRLPVNIFYYKLPRISNQIEKIIIGPTQKCVYVTLLLEISESNRAHLLEITGSDRAFAKLDNYPANICLNLYSSMRAALHFLS